MRSSHNTVRCKLAVGLTALEDGADPDEEESGPTRQKRSDRPLDLCLDDSEADLAEESLLNKIPVIQMLLGYEAETKH